jgi:hypothetical protein
MLCRFVNLGAMMTISLSLSLAQVDLGSGSQNAASKSLSVIEGVVKRDSSAVKSKFPNAQLFQVSIFGLVPKALSDQETVNASVQTSYYIGSQDRYVQATQRETADLKAVPEVVEKSSKPEACDNGYPLPGSEVCAPQTDVLAGQPPPLGVREVSELRHLPDWLAKEGLAPSDQYDVTITTASQLSVATKSSQSREVLEMSPSLAQLKPDQIVFSVTDRRGERSRIGSTIFFNAATGEVIGRSRVLKQRLPPSARP